MIDNLAKPEINWDINKKVFIKENVLDTKLCDDLIDFGNANVHKGVNKYPHLFNISFDACLLPLKSSLHNSLQEVWKECIDCFQFQIDFVEPYELKRYSNSDFFEKHIDNYYSLSVNIDRKITMSVQLSDVNEYGGGEFNILGSKHKLSKGSIIAFPSFFPHAVEKITSGIRWSVIGWAWGPYWK